nr:hypothetical protein [uncultured Desulfobulbus sp.]
MESGLLFTAAVIGVGALHLVWQAATSIERKTSQQTSSQSSKKHESKRADWYMFFFRSDITGKETRQIAPTASKSEQTRRTPPQKQKRRSAQQMQL